MKDLKTMLMIVLLIGSLSIISSADELNIDLVGGDNGFVYYYGQKVDLRINLDRPSYLIIYAISLEGDIRIVFPNSEIRDNYVSSGTSYISRYSELLADIEGPLFMVAISSPDSRLSFRYQDRDIPLWSPHWGEYHPTYSFIGDSGFGRDNNFPVVLARRAPRFHSRRLINDFEFDKIIDELNDKINRDFDRFDKIIDYFLADFNEAVSNINFSFSSQTKEMYIAGSRYNSDIYDQRGVSVGSSSAYHETSGSSTSSIRFDVHLDPYGYWVYIDGIRMWRPHVSISWRPFVHGFWRWSRRGWVWICYSPWRITYNYGYWHYDWRYGYVWIPGYQWHPAWVTWYYGSGYIGWRPAPPPRRYTSRIRTQNYTRIQDHNPYVFVSSRDFTATDLSARVISDNVFEKQIRPQMAGPEMKEFPDGERFYEEVSMRERMSVKSVDLENTQVQLGGNERFEAVFPKLDQQEKDIVNTRQREIMNEVETRRQQIQPSRDEFSADRDIQTDRRVIQRDRPEQTRTVTPGTVSRDSRISSERRDTSGDERQIQRSPSPVQRSTDSSGERTIERTPRPSESHREDTDRDSISGESRSSGQISIIDRRRDIDRDSRESDSDSQRSITRTPSPTTRTPVTRPSSRDDSSSGSSTERSVSRPSASSSRTERSVPESSSREESSSSSSTERSISRPSQRESSSSSSSDRTSVSPSSRREESQSSSSSDSSSSSRRRVTPSREESNESKEKSID